MKASDGKVVPTALTPLLLATCFRRDDKQHDAENLRQREAGEGKTGDKFICDQQVRTSGGASWSIRGGRYDSHESEQHASTERIR